jgi:hypothetical protein
MHGERLEFSVAEQRVELLGDDVLLADELNGV